jgi:periplasmic divalent cation tolerance protein
MTGPAIVMIETTTATRAEALALARACLEARVAACAHVDAIASLFRWDGAMREEEEFRLLLKTTEACVPEASRIIRAGHSYDEPAILVLPVAGGAPSFLAWIAEGADGAA